ncbi:MAG: ABC transporter substrate-binding protein [Gaiellaceae bacterium]
MEATTAHKRRRNGLAGAVALAVGVALLAAACSSGGRSKASRQPPPSKAYSTLRVTWEEPGSMDPGLANTIAAWQVLWNVNLGLLGYKHVAGVEGTKLVPYLAESLPTISSNGTVYKFKLRPNLKYSNGRPVEAKDFLYTIKRDYLIKSPGARLFSSILGAADFGRTKKGKIPGIVTNDVQRTITIKLSHPMDGMENILATVFAAPVPTGTPKPDQSTRAIPSTGPYMVKSYTPRRGFVLVRNPSFKSNKIPDVPAGYPDEVVGKMASDPATALRSVLSGHSDYDALTVPIDRLPDLRHTYSRRLKLYTSPTTYYYFMNERVPPFSKLEARQAVNYAIDRNAIAEKILAGLAKPTQNILPPSYPQYKKIDYYEYDLGKAIELVRKSRTVGMKITVWGVNTPLSNALTEYLAGVLDTIGWRATPKLLGSRTEAQIGFADRYQAFPNPIDWFAALFKHGNARFPDVGKRIGALAQKTGTNAGGWASIDHDLVVKYAAAAPFANGRGTDFFGPKIDTGCYVFHVLYRFDFSQICMK